MSDRATEGPHVSKVDIAANVRDWLPNGFTNGDDGTSALQQALDDNIGNTVYLPANIDIGITAPVNVWRDTNLIGASVTSILTKLAAFDGPTVQVATDGEVHAGNSILAHFQVRRGAGVTVATAAGLRLTGTNYTVTDVFASSFYEGFQFDDVDGAHLAHCKAEDVQTGGSGYRFKANAKNLHLTGCRAVNSSGTGFLHDSGGAFLNTLTGCYTNGCEVGFDMVAGHGLRMIGCHARSNNSTGFRLGGGASLRRSVLSGCIAWQNGMVTNGPGFHLRTSDYVSLVGCHAYDDQGTPTQTSDLTVDGDATNYDVTGGSLTV